MNYRHKLLLLYHTEIVEKREQSGERCRTRGSKIVSYRYQEEEGSLKYKICWTHTETHTENIQRGTDIICYFLRQSVLYKNCRDILAATTLSQLGIQVYHKPSYLICSSYKKYCQAHFVCAVTSEHIQILRHSQKRSWTILENALLPIN